MKARTKRVAEDCVANDIPFVVLPANDPHALAAVEHYVELCDEDNDIDHSYVRAVSADAQRMDIWRKEHPDEVEPPALLEGES